MLASTILSTKDVSQSTTWTTKKKCRLLTYVWRHQNMCTHTLLTPIHSTHSIFHTFSIYSDVFYMYSMCTEMYTIFSSIPWFSYFLSTSRHSKFHRKSISFFNLHSKIYIIKYYAKCNYYIFYKMIIYRPTRIKLIELIIIWCKCHVVKIGPILKWEATNVDLCSGTNAVLKIYIYVCVFELFVLYVQM